MNRSQLNKLAIKIYPLLKINNKLIRIASKIAANVALSVVINIMMKSFSQPSVIRKKYNDLYLLGISDVGIISKEFLTDYKNNLLKGVKNYV